MSRIWRKYFNRSGAALGLLAAWLGWFVYLETNVPPRTITGETSFYVLVENRGFFNESRYTVLVGRELWRVEGVDLKVGREYRGVVRRQEFSIRSDDSFERYLRGTGLRGELLVDPVDLEINQSCDWLCRGITLVRENRYRAGRRAQEFSCHTATNLWGGLYYTDVTCADVASLVTGLTYGDVTAMSPGTKGVVRRFGLSHLVAVSGFQVVLVASFLEVALRRSRIGFKKRVLLILLGLLGLGLYTGLQPPIVRSLLSTLVILLARLLGRRCSQRRALLYSGAVMLVLNPFYIFSISFQLSCLATWALLETRLTSRIGNALLAPTNAFLYTLPVIVGFAGEVSPVGIVANILLAGVVPGVTYLCLLGFLPGVGELFLGVANLLILLTLNVLTDLSAYVDLVTLSPFGPGEIWGYYVALTLINFLLRKVLNAKKTTPPRSSEVVT